MRRGHEGRRSVPQASELAELPTTAAEAHLAQHVSRPLHGLLVRQRADILVCSGKGGKGSGGSASIQMDSTIIEPSAARRIQNGEGEKKGNPSQQRRTRQKPGHSPREVDRHLVIDLRRIDAGMSGGNGHTAKGWRQRQPRAHRTGRRRYGETAAAIPHRKFSLFFACVLMEVAKGFESCLSARAPSLKRGKGASFGKGMGTRRPGNAGAGASKADAEDRAGAP